MPASDLSIVEGGQDATLRVKARQLNRRDCIFGTVGHGIHSCEEHVVPVVIRHGVSLHHTEIDNTKAGANGKVLTIRSVHTAGDGFILLKCNPVDAVDFEGIDRDQLYVAVCMTDHSILVARG